MSIGDMTAPCSLAKRLVPAAVVAVILLAGAGARAQEWPLESEWWPVLFDGEPATDVCDDAQGPRDIVGTLEHPVVFLYFSYPEPAEPADYMFVRMRIDDDPSQGDGLAPFGWAVEFDVDSDITTYEYIGMANGIVNPDQITLEKNTVQEDLDSPSDPAEELLGSWPYETNGRVFDAPSSLCGTPDFYLDFFFPMQPLYDDGLDPEQPMSLVFGTSQNAHSITDDLIDNDETSDPFTLEEGSSDPVGQDSDGDGIYDFEDNCPDDYNPDQADSDDDGVGDECDDGSSSDSDVDTDGDSDSDADSDSDIDSDADTDADGDADANGTGDLGLTGSGALPTCSVGSAPGTDRGPDRSWWIAFAVALLALVRRGLHPRDS